MSNNYLKNILDKNSQANMSVEPRLKSRFEASNVISNDDIFTDTSERENPYIQKKYERDVNASEVKENNFTNNFKTIHLDETIKNVNHDNQTQFLNTTENHFHLSKLKGEENRKERMETVLPKTKEVFKESIVIHSEGSNNTIENKNYGMLNKPLKTSPPKVNHFNEDFKASIKQNTLTTPEKPSIKISIGRVEVRAVKSAKKIPAASKVQPNLKMSLEDYIDKRK